jgi:hypothetical protein
VFPGLAHRTVRCTIGHCPVHQGAQLQNAYLRKFWEPLRYNSPDCPVQHRTVRCNTGLSGATPDYPVCQRSNGYIAPTVICNGTVKVNSSRLRTQKSEQRQKAHRTVNSDCPVHHRTVRWARSQKLQRSNPNGRVTWLAHRTVWCAMRQQPSPTAILVVGVINTPNHPPFIASKFSAIKPHTRAIDFIQRHNQRDQILSQVRNHSKEISD